MNVFPILLPSPERAACGYSRPGPAFCAAGSQPVRSAPRGADDGRFAPAIELSLAGEHSRVSGSDRSGSHSGKWRAAGYRYGTGRRHGPYAAPAAASAGPTLYEVIPETVQPLRDEREPTTTQPVKSLAAAMKEHIERARGDAGARGRARRRGGSAGDQPAHPAGPDAEAED